MVISGYNIRAVIACCRWATAHGVEFHVIARNESDPIFLTDYGKKVAVVRQSEQLGTSELLSWVAAIRTDHRAGKILILPSTEYLNRTLLKHRTALEQDGCVIPLAPADLYEQLSDKDRFAQVCAEHGIEIPEPREGTQSDLPFVAKPRAYASRTGRQLIPHLIRTEADRARFIAEEQDSDYFFQEFVFGRSLYLLAHIAAEEEDLLFSQENLIQQARGGSVVLARPADFHHGELAGQYVSMLHQLRFTGLVMIEVRVDPAAGRACMIEANPRIWGPLQLSLDNGIDFLGALLSNHGFGPFQPDAAPSDARSYLWSGGLSADPELPATYHNYSAEQFANELPTLKTDDLFCREDTLDLYAAQSGAERHHE